MARVSAVSGATAAAAARPAGWRRWPRWIGYAAAAWSLGYGLLGLAWAFGAPGFPFGRGYDPDAELSWFGAARPGIGGPLIAALGLVGAAVALAAAASWGRRLPRAPLLAFAWGAAAVLLLVVPDYRVLVAVAYAPIFLVGAPFGWPPVSYREAVPWPVVNQFLCIAGGLAWAATAVAWGRGTGGAGARPGRVVPAGWTTPAAAARWGRWATGVAVVVPCLYAATRWAWALGIPLGISDEFYRQGQAEGLWWAGAALATVAVAGAGLTLGLAQQWGEVFPGWLPLVGGRSVPPALAVVPAALVALVVTQAGLMYVRLALQGRWAGEGENWAAIGPELVWPVWGVALGAAALAYLLRRRGGGSPLRTSRD